MKIQTGLRQVFVWLTVLLTMSLVGCAGTVKHLGAAPTGVEPRVQGVAKVVLELTPEVKDRLVNSGRFNQEELARRIRDRLTGKGLIAEGAGQYVDILITDVRIRNTFNAIMFGFMAGDDRVNGRIRLMNVAGQELRAFEVNASYALGGFGGGQDGTRVNWLYEKFAELALQELDKMISAPSANGYAAVTKHSSGATDSGVPMSVTVRPASPPPIRQPMGDPRKLEQPVQASAVPPAPVASVKPGVSSEGGEMIVLPPASAADKVLANSQIAHRYHLYLSRPNPKAFAVSESGGWWMAWGESLNPMVKESITQRALRGCQERSKAPCVLFAVDDTVVYRNDSGDRP